MPLSFFFPLHQEAEDEIMPKNRNATQKKSKKNLGICKCQVKRISFHFSLF